MGFSRIFRSRWAALLWAGGILWTAYDVANANAPAHRHAPGKAAARPAMQTDATGAPVDKDDLAVLANAMSG